MSKPKRPEVFDICFIDCDLIKYRASFAAEKTEWLVYDHNGDFVRSFWSAKAADEYVDGLSVLDLDTEGYTREKKVTVGELEQGIKAVDFIMEKIYKKCPAKEYRYYLTGNDDYRPGIATLHKYKGNRPPKPYWLEEITQYIETQYEATVVNHIEADDTLTVGLTYCHRKGIKGVVANLDKDIKQAVGWHYDWDKDKFEYITEWQGLLHTYCQAIAGDAVDNYKGIPNIGMKKAMKMLKDCQSEREMYEVAIKAYRDGFGEVFEYESWDGKPMKKTAEELFLENMRLAYMQRRKDEFYKIPSED